MNFLKMCWTVKCAQIALIAISKTVILFHLSLPELFNATVYRVSRSFSPEAISSTQEKNWDVRRELFLSALESETNYFALFF